MNDYLIVVYKPEAAKYFRGDCERRFPHHFHCQNNLSRPELVETMAKYLFADKTADSHDVDHKIRVFKGGVMVYRSSEPKAPTSGTPEARCKATERSEGDCTLPF